MEENKVLGEKGLDVLIEYINSLNIGEELKEIKSLVLNLSERLEELEAYDKVKSLTSQEYQSLVDEGKINEDVIYITEDDETAAATLDLPNSEFAIPMPNFLLGNINDTTITNDNKEE